MYESLILELKQIINSYYDKYYLSQVIIDKCILDNERIFEELPKDKIITNNLKVDFKLVCFPKKFIKKIKDNFIKINLNILNTFCSSYIKSQSYVKKIIKDKVSFLDIGWRRSSFIFFDKKKLKFIETIPIGGFNITKDISKIFEISETDAEELKKSLNKTYTEFAYENNKLENSNIIQEIINKNISIDLLKKLYFIESKKLWIYLLKNQKLIVVSIL